jgi:hypothetical protein
MDCIDPCPRDNDPTLDGECGCPSGVGATALQATGTLCEGLCGGKGTGNTSGIDQCDGAGHCGTASTCLPGGCTGVVTKDATYLKCPSAVTNAVGASVCAGVPGMSLPKVINATQNGFLQSIITSDTWIAANDSFVEGTWRWSPDNKTPVFWSGTSTGSAAGGSYANWAAGQPAAGTAAANDCGVMVSAGASAGKWQARTCTDTRSVVCMRDETGPSPRRDMNVGPSNTLTSCQIRGNCPPPNTGACVQPNTVPGMSNPTQAVTDMRNCDACVRSAANADVCGAANPTAAQKSACSARCSGQCNGVAEGPPPGAALVTCENMGSYAANPSSVNPPYPIPPDPERRCTLKSTNRTPCTSHASCGGSTPHCGYAFYCKTADNVLTNRTCTPKHPGGAGVYPTAGSGSRVAQCAANEECVGDLYCGVAIDACFLNDNSSDMCFEYDMCIDPANEVQSVMPMDAITRLTTPTTLEPVTAFPVTETPIVSTGNWPTDGPCRTAGCTIPTSYNPSNIHKWCSWEPDGKLNDRRTPAVDKSAEPKGDGPSKSLSFKFDPKLDLDFSMANGPLGIPLPYAGANAQMIAKTTVQLFGLPSKTFDVIDLGLDVHGGIKMSKLREDPATTTTDICGVLLKGRAKILKIDILPSNLKNYALPEPADQQECLRLLRKYTDAVDRARKAYADARELRTQYNSMLGATRRFHDGTGAQKSLCETLGLLTPPGPKTGPFIFPTGSGDCTKEKPEVTINRFIHYANYTTQVALREAAQELIDTLDTTASIRGTALTIPVVNAHEEITIFNQTFMIGPIPVNLEVLLPVTYGINGTLTYEFRIGEALNQLILAQPGEPTVAIAKIGATGRPYAGAGISLFAGVGFDIGFLSAKIGLEGAIDLGRIEIPTGGWAGVGMASVKDARTLTAAQTQLVEPGRTNDPLIPARKISFRLLYGYDLGIKIDHVLDGELNGKLKLKFFWFSLTYRQRIVRFYGFCRTDNGADAKRPKREDWCDTTLLKGGGELDPGWDWGAVQSPLAFFQLPYIRTFAPATHTMNAGFSAANVGKLGYDSLCQCVPGWDFTKPASQNTAKVCYRDSDCCPGTGTCNVDLTRDDGGGRCWVVVE